MSGAELSADEECTYGSMRIRNFAKPGDYYVKIFNAINNTVLDQVLFYESLEAIQLK